MDYYRSLNASTLDPDIPTVFELFAAKQLTDLINPYIRFILVHYAQSHPQYLLRLVKRFDEIYLVLFGFVEYAHLRQWNSSFVEKFYGLKRVNRLPVQLPRTGQRSGATVDRLRQLTKKQIALTLVAIVGVPYLKEKAQARYERLVSRYTFKDIEEDRPAYDAPIYDHWKYQADVALIKWFPRLLFLENTAQLAFCLSYLFRGTGPFSISDWVINTRYSRISSNDVAFNESQSRHKNKYNVLKPVLHAFGYVLPTTLFAIKFLEWWNTSRFPSKFAFIGPDLAPPNETPSATSTTTTSTAAHEPKQLQEGCPICHKTELDTPSVLETGVSFCYKCIWDYLQNMAPEATPRCPVTGIELLLTEWNKSTNQWDIGGIRRLMI